MVQVHFTLHLKKNSKKEVHGVTKISEWMKIVLDVLHGTTWIMLHALLNIVLGPSKRGADIKSPPTNG
jgi:hypothetical protein